MSINYLLSGMDRELGFYEKQKEYLKKDIKNNSIITFISSSFDDIKKSNKYYNLMLDWFNKINISFKESFLINSKREIIEFDDFDVEIGIETNRLFFMNMRPTNNLNMQIHNIEFDNGIFKLYGVSNESKRYFWKDF